MTNNLSWLKISELVKIEKKDIIYNKIYINNKEYFLSKKIINLIKKNNKNKSRYLLTSLSKNNNNKHLTTRSIEMIIKKYLNDYSYNDLKTIHYKSLLSKLPDITKIHNHITNDTINLQEINNII
jgi:hypothetical protein